MRNIKLKLGKMRKTQSYVIYPYQIGDKNIIIQSEKTCGLFSRETGTGFMNFRSNRLQLISPRYGGIPFALEKETLKAFLDIQKKKGGKENENLHS
jgi:hypothetical protein